MKEGIVVQSIKRSPPNKLFGTLPSNSSLTFINISFICSFSVMSRASPKVPTIMRFFLCGDGINSRILYPADFEKIRKVTGPILSPAKILSNWALANGTSSG